MKFRILKQGETGYIVEMKKHFLSKWRRVSNLMCSEQLCKDIIKELKKKNTFYKNGFIIEIVHED